MKLFRFNNKVTLTEISEKKLPEFLKILKGLGPVGPKELGLAPAFFWVR